MFIVFEGVDGVGKSSHIRGIADFILKMNIPHICTSEFNDEAIGKNLRYVLMNCDLTGEEEILLINVVRSYHARETLLPAINAGQWILMDRFVESTFAYQHGGKEVPYSVVEKLVNLIDFPKPDLTILLDGENHRLKPKDKFDGAGAEFFKRVNDVYNKRFNDQTWRRYNTNLGYSVVQDMIRKDIREKI